MSYWLAKCYTIIDHDQHLIVIASQRVLEFIILIIITIIVCGHQWNSGAATLKW